jgi:alpha-L-arabinofuranosidase
LTQDIPARIYLRGFSPGPEALVTSLYSDTIYDQNDAATPKKVYPQEAHVSVSSGQIQYTFRHASVTKIQFSE